MTGLVRLLLCTALVAASPAIAAEDGQTGGGGSDAATAAPKAPTVSDLLDALSRSDNAAVAGALEQQILARWGQSGSETTDLLMEWALTAIEERDFAQAIDILSEVVVLAPDYAEGWNKRATVYYLIDEYALSMSDIHHVLALEPRHFGALSGLGLILRETGDSRNALAAFRKALEVNPFLENARKAIDELTVQVEGRGI